MSCLSIVLLLDSLHSFFTAGDPCLHVHEGDASVFTGLVPLFKDFVLGFNVVAKATLKAVEDYHLHECPVLVVPRHEVADELVVRHVFDVHRYWI